MNKKQAIKRVRKYLDSRGFYSRLNLAGKHPKMTTYFWGHENCPDERIECTIFFYKDRMTLGLFFSQAGAKIIEESENRDDLLPLARGINRSLSLESNLSNPFLINLFDPILYMDEDRDSDLFIVETIDYAFFEENEKEVLYYLTKSLPGFFNNLSVSIFSILDGSVDVEELLIAINRIYYERRQGESSSL